MECLAEACITGLVAECDGGYSVIPVDMWHPAAPLQHETVTQLGPELFTLL